MDSGAEATLEYRDYLRRKSPTIRHRLLAYGLKDIEDLSVLIKWLRLKSEEMGLAYSDRFKPSTTYLDHLKSFNPTVERHLRVQYGTYDLRMKFPVKSASEASRVRTLLQHLGFRGNFGYKRGEIEGVVVYGNMAVPRLCHVLGVTLPPK